VVTFVDYLTFRERVQYENLKSPKYVWLLRYDVSGVSSSIPSKLYDDEKLPVTVMPVI
jgi:hypothetical protein